MKIVVQENKKSIKILFPTKLALNSVTATVASRIIQKKKGLVIPAKKLRQLFKVIYRSKRKWKDWEIVHVESKKGEKVVIKL